MKTIAIITCTKRKKKTNEKIAAKDLYSISPLFKYSYEYVKKVLGLKDEQIFILSAKYNLINANEKIEYYDQTFKTNPPIEWRNELKKRLDKINPDKIYYIGSKKYIKKFLKENREYKDKFIIIADGLTIGKKIQQLKKEIEMMGDENV